LKEFHSHFSKIEYSAGGEKKHLTFEDTVFGPNFEPLMELIYKKNLSPTFICESAGTQAEDAKVMKDYYLSL
ncbi:MAG: endonuclease IV, partial [Clostridia bacterium]|nr:endonuclease IV [Clostridia bacterium]